MSHDIESAESAPRVFYLAVVALPASFERVAEWAEVLVAEHPHMLGMLGLIDCSRLPFEQQAPSVDYLTGLAAALAPLMRAATRTRCAILVAHRPWVWRARLFESLTSGSGVAFRAFESTREAMAWLYEDADAGAERQSADGTRACPPVNMG